MLGLFCAAVGCADTSMSRDGPAPALPPPAVGRERIVPASDYGAFPERFTWQGRRFALQGAGLCEFGFLGIDLYRAALYVERPVSAADELLRCDQDLLLHLHFVRGLSAAQLRAAYEASVGVNAGDDARRYDAALGQLLAAMRDVAVGDGYTFAVLGGRELVVQRNDVELARIDDAAFARLFVRLYFGDQPPDANMKRAMLEGGR